ncbi:hypothetical protein BHE74_00023177 [Ensete ventricosum]|nr:hypothetical protein BHE74_00023177 [Ensete ventricosum]RZR98266.1 hypothetical protein BHM03_00027583 [Ensete ventricosum]
MWTKMIFHLYGPRLVKDEHHKQICHTRGSRSSVATNKNPKQRNHLEQDLSINKYGMVDCGSIHHPQRKDLRNLEPRTLISHQQIPVMAPEAWLIDESHEDQRLPHHRNPKEFVPLSKLQEIGVLYWHLDPKNYESSEELKKIREDRGYNYMVCISLSLSLSLRDVHGHRHPVTHHDSVMRIYIKCNCLKIVFFTHAQICRCTDIYRLYSDLFSETNQHVTSAMYFDQVSVPPCTAGTGGTYRSNGLPVCGPPRTGRCQLLHSI